MSDDEDIADEEDFSDESEVERDLGDFTEREPTGLSHVGAAAYKALSSQHAKYRGVCWNVTTGAVVGSIAQTPPGKYWERQIGKDAKMTHSDELPVRIGELMATGTRFVDFASLGPPDGKFLEAMKGAIKALHESGKDIVVRVITGNVIGMPIDNDDFCRQLTEDLGDESKLKIWVASWRKGLSWNHSKIVAVDGERLFAGGHNLWDAHYLQWNPVRDVSFQCEGMVAQDGHLFVNRMWRYVTKRHAKLASQFGSGGFKPSILKSNVGIARWPRTIDEYPPAYGKTPKSSPKSDTVPMLSIGRYGELHHDASTANPSDSAITAMLACAQKSIKMCLQDLGPLAVPLPTGPVAIPGGVWPEQYLRAIGKCIYERGVDVHLVVSHPNSCPADLKMTEAYYGNGWTVEDVASEVIKSIKANHPGAEHDRLAGLVTVNLKVTYMRSTCGPVDWEETHGKSGNHAKFFCVDDAAFYIGSQNLYIANLAEWGVVVDSRAETQKVLEEYWNPLWRQSYELVEAAERDLDVGKVLEGCGVDRQCPPEQAMTEEQWEQILLRKQATMAGSTERKLCVWLKSAKGLRNADGLGSGSSDSYVRFKLVDKKGRQVGITQESRIVWDGGANPEWQQQFEFEGLKKPGEYTLKMKVLDKDSLLGMKGKIADWLNKDDKLGAATFELRDLKKSMSWQHREIKVAARWFHNSTLRVAFNTVGRWGK